MRIAVIATFRHPSRLPLKERSVMQPAAPELIAGLCPVHAEVEIYNEKEVDVPLDRHWDLVFFSYLDPFYEHTKVLSTLFRRAGMKTVAGGRHASRFPGDCKRHFDAVVIGDPETSVPRLVADFERGHLQPIYQAASVDPARIRAYRYDLIDFDTNRLRVSTVEASRGCPFACSFCVLTGHERYHYRPVAHVIDDIRHAMRWNRHYWGRLRRTFMFYDNNLGGSPGYLRDLCEALRPLKKTWGCALTFNVLEDERLIRLMGQAGCRFIYTGLETLNPDSIVALNKRQNHLQQLRHVIGRTYASGILLSFGLVVGADGDTNEYLARLPEYLGDLQMFAITFLGILCPFPGTPLFAQVAREGRLLPGATIRDFDTYTVCHRPLRLDPSEVVDHYRTLCASLGRMTNVVRHCWTKLGLSSLPGYNLGLLVSAPEIASIKHNTRNPRRTYIAGTDVLEEWDRSRMDELGLAPQSITTAGVDARAQRAG